MKKKKTNIREIAKLAGVSVASVSRALKESEADKVSPELRKKILKICDDLQYFPNMHTVRMFTKKANNIAFIYPPFEELNDEMNRGQMDPNLAACINGSEEVLSNHGIYLTLTSTTDKFLNDKEYLKITRSKMVDGVLVWGWTEGQSFIEDLKAENVPMVMVQCAAEDDTYNSVIADDITGMEAVVEHVLGMGHRNIAVVSPSQFSSAGRNRYSSIKTTLKKHGIDAYFSQRGGFGPDCGYYGAQEIFEKAPTATCIIAPNDTSVIGVFKAAKEKGIRIPEDLSVTGADGVRLISPIEFTSYLSPSYEIGKKGAELLLQKIEKPKSKPEQLVMPVTFIEGETVCSIK